MSAIEAKRSSRESGRGRHFDPRVRPALLLMLVVLFVFSLGSLAYAGRASTGKLAFFPCTQCHPVSVDANGNPNHALPNGFKKHEIVLEVHDTLGKGSAGCLVCHDDPMKNPGMLKLADGSLVDIKGDVSQVCLRCHFEKYREFKAGIHGKRLDKCTAAGCHDPHTPSWIYIAALPPFQGTGIQVHAVNAREPFKALAPPPVPPATITPTWLVVISGLGALLMAALIAYLIFGGSKR